MAAADKKRTAEQDGGSPADVAAEADTPKLLPADVRRLLEPLSKDQLLDILQDATCRHIDVLNIVRALTDVDANIRKIIVRGLDWDTTNSSLHAAFSAYGDIREAVVIVDKSTRKSKGYGFVTFCHVDSALLASKEPRKIIDGRVTVTQLSGNAVPRDDVLQRKIFISGVPEDMPAERLRQHFSQYGEIEQGPYVYGKSLKSNGYTIFVYKTPQAASAAVVEKVKKIDGHDLTCSLSKRAGLPVTSSGASTAIDHGAIPGSSKPVTSSGASMVIGHGAIPGSSHPVTSSGASTVIGHGAIPGSSDGLGELSSFGGGGARSHYSLSSNLPPSLGVRSSGLMDGRFDPPPSPGRGAIPGSSDGLGKLSSFGEVGARSHYSLSSNLPSSLGVQSSGLMDARFDPPPSPGRGAIPGSSNGLGKLSSFGDVGARGHYSLSSNLPSSLDVRSSGLVDARFDPPPSPGRSAIPGSSDGLGKLSSFGDVGARSHYSLSSNLPSSLGVRSSGLMDARFDPPPSPGSGAIPGSSDGLGKLSSFGDVGARSHYSLSSNLPSSLCVQSSGLLDARLDPPPSPGRGAIPGSSDGLGELSSFGGVGARSHYSLSSNLPSSLGVRSSGLMDARFDPPPSPGRGAIPGSSDGLGKSSSFGGVGARNHYSLSSNLPSSLGVRSSGLMDARLDPPPSSGRGAGFSGGYSSSSQVAGIGHGGGSGAGGYDGLGYGGGAHYHLGSSGITSGGDYGYSSSALRGQHQHQHQQLPLSPPDYKILPQGREYQPAMPPYY